MNRSTMELGPSNQSLDRQIQINEWQYHSKMDTVFALQLVFISVLIISIVFYFKKIGKVGSYFAYYVSGLTAILVSMIIINRLFFTSARRDPRFWHRYRFQDDGGKVPSQVSSSSSMSDFWSGFWQNQPAAVAKCPDCPLPTTTTATATATRIIDTLALPSEPYNNNKVYNKGDVILYEGNRFKMNERVGAPGYNPGNRLDLWTRL